MNFHLPDSVMQRAKSGIAGLDDRLRRSRSHAGPHPLRPANVPRFAAGYPFVESPQSVTLFFSTMKRDWRSSIVAVPETLRAKISFFIALLVTNCEYQSGTQKKEVKTRQTRGGPNLPDRIQADALTKLLMVPPVLSPRPPGEGNRSAASR
jgi:hypothetical protein